MSESTFQFAHTYPYYLANQPLSSSQTLEVRDKYTGEVVTRVAQADAVAVDKAIGQAEEAAEAMAALPSHKRQSILEYCQREFEKRSEELAYLLCVEAGKPLGDSRGEVTRLIHTFKIAAEEAVRSQGEVLALDRLPSTVGYRGMWKRVPLGPCSFITPFNFPLNLAAHKIAPAIAAGCPFVLKPDPRTPVSTMIIGQVLAETDLPPGAFSLLPTPVEEAGAFVTDERLKLLSFTGSHKVGWDLKSKAGKKKVVLELGGNAGCIIDETSDWEKAVPRVIRGAFYQSGQSCISVQRVYLHQSIYDDFRDKVVDEARKLKLGDPKEEDTFLGPIISEEDALRIESWIREGENKGGKVLCGGTREGNLIAATVMENVPSNLSLCAEEIFGPVVLLYPFGSFDEALREVNNSKYGLQAGVFTKEIGRMHQAWDELVVGGVMINEIPSWRVDHMPYGGVKDSGFGREGLRYSIEDMTEKRLLVIKDL